MRSRGLCDINSDMAEPRFKLPGTSALTAFELAARLGNFTQAAAELNTSQPAVSRHVAELEKRLGVALFQRGPQGPILTREGLVLYRAVSSGLGEIRSTINTLRRQSQRPTVTVACSYDIAHLILMPRYTQLSDALGGAKLRVLAAEFEHIGDLRGAEIDLAIAGGMPPGRRDPATRLFAEMVWPVASREFWESHGNPINPEALAALPLLELDKPNFGWLDWRRWLGDTVPVGPAGPVKRFPNYVYVLEAAAAGEGVALGWLGYTAGYEAAGRLVRAPVDPVTTDGGCFASPDPASPVGDLVALLVGALRDQVGGSTVSSQATQLSGG